MAELLKGQKGAVCSSDGVLIAGSSVPGRAERVEAVLHRLAEDGIRVKQQKCKAFKDAVKYLGRLLDANRVHPCASERRSYSEGI